MINHHVPTCEFESHDNVIWKGIIKILNILFQSALGYESLSNSYINSS